MKKEQETVPAQERSETVQEEPGVIQEIVVEELSIDGVCGVY